MKCIKNTKRTFFNFFEIFSCDNCDVYLKYDYVYIGNNTINIYEFSSKCNSSFKKQEFIGLFFKEMILNLNDLFIILEKSEYIKLFDYLPFFIENNNIFILII